jgi:hypothetical protein
MSWVLPIPSPASEYGSPPGPKWGEPQSLAGGGDGRRDPIQTTGQTLWYSTYIVIPLQVALFMSKHHLWQLKSLTIPTYAATISHKVLQPQSDEWVIVF